MNPSNATGVVIMPLNSVRRASYVFVVFAEFGFGSNSTEVSRGVSLWPR